MNTTVKPLARPQSKVAVLANNKKGIENIFSIPLNAIDKTVTYKPLNQHSVISATEGPVNPNFSARIL